MQCRAGELNGTNMVTSLHLEVLTLTSDLLQAVRVVSKKFATELT